MLRAIFGADPIDAGEIRSSARPARIRSPRDAIALGIGLLTEDRKADGLLLLQSVAFNVTITQLGRRVEPAACSATARSAVPCSATSSASPSAPPGPRRSVRNLSGGNQQKAIFAKWLHAALPDPADRRADPRRRRRRQTARSTRLLAALAASGVAIVMVSSELPEILAVSDRVIVMREGRVTAELDRAEATEERIMHHATHG